MHKHVDESMKSRESLTLWINELLDPSGLLLAGDKRTQTADIKTAQEYLFDYRSRDDAQE